MRFFTAHRRVLLVLATILALGASGGTLALFTAQDVTGDTNLSTDALNKHFEVTPGTAVRPSTSTAIASGDVDTLTMDFGTTTTNQTFTDVFRVKNIASAARTAELSTANLPAQIASLKFASSNATTVTLNPGDTAMVTVVTSATTGTGSGSVTLGRAGQSFPTRTYPIQIQNNAAGTAPAAPTTVALANGGGVGNAYINGANRASLSVSVGLPASSQASDTVHVTITDGTNTTADQTTPASAGAGTVTVTGINATSLNDGSVTIRATSSNGFGTSSQTTTSVTKDTVKPSSSAGTVADIYSGTSFTVPYTSADTSPSSTLDKVELYVDPPGGGTNVSLTNTDATPSASGESFSYTGATDDGTYDFYTRAYDKAGNAEDAPGAADSTATRTTLRMATGSYTGNGIDNRTVSGLGFQPDVVIVKTSAVTSVMRTSSMPSGATAANTKQLTGGALQTNMIKTLTSDGFTLGTDNAVNNSNGVTYHWIAFKAADRLLKVGSYTGNGGASQAVTGAGFEPEWAAVMSANANGPNQRYAGMSDSFAFGTGGGAANRINSLDADGFTVGSNGEVNTNGIVYYYVLFNQAPGAIESATYAGNGTSQSITGVGFQPDYVMLRGAANVQGHHRPASLSGTSSLFFSGTNNLASGGITALTADGFDVGNNAAVNATPNTYHYLAFRNTAGGSSQFSTSSVTASDDTWVNQALPTANNGADTLLRVTSLAAGNTRALVLFPLPSTPGGFTMKSAHLYMNSTVSAAGRTIVAQRAAAGWTEATNWNNQPGATGTAVTAASGLGFLEWPVTSLVSDLYTGPNNGFVLSDQAEGDATIKEQRYSSSEASNTDLRPRLTVTFGN